MPPSDAAGWRLDLHVLARVLQRLRRPDATFTRCGLQRATGPNHDLFRKYLGSLESRGLATVTKDGDRDVVRLTREGVRLHEDLARWLASLFGDAEP